MASTFSTNLKIELQTTGENSGTWGTITNTNLGTALEQAIVGYGNPSYASDANLTLTYTDTNAAQTARALVLNVTSAVSLSATRELVVPTIQKQYIVQNNTTGSQSITVKTSGGTGITVPNGRKAHLYVNGTDVIYMDDYVDINGGAIDGTPIGANSASTGSFTTLATSSTVTVNGGTANQVQYLNASKQQVGSANLTFDGTTLTAANFADSSLTSGRVTYAGASGNLTDSASLTFDGTTLATTTVDATNVEVTNIKAKDGTAAASIADSTGVISLTSNPTLSGGTANGVLYLNGSKVATSGSALTFDGSSFLVGATSAAAGKMVVKDTASSNTLWLIGRTSDGASSVSFRNAADSAYNARLEGVSNQLLFEVGGSEGMRLTSTGLGIGVTPNTNWTTYSVLELGKAGGGYIANTQSGGFLGIGNNFYFNSGYKYATNGTASFYYQQSGQHIWQTAASGTAGNAITFTQAMLLDENRRLFLNATSGVGSEQALIAFNSAGAYSQALNTKDTNASSNNNSHIVIRRSDDTYLGALGRAGTDTAMFVDGNSYLSFRTGATERMRLDSSGNLGLGVTPSAWSSAFGPVIQVKTGSGGGALTGSSTDNFRMFANTFYDGAYKRIGAGYATQYEQAAGTHVWYTAATSTANSSISFTQAMTLDASGNLGINTTAPGTFGKLAVQVAGTTTPANSTNVGPSSINLYAAGNGGSTNCTTGIFGWNSNDPGIGSGIGFSRENSSDWGTQIRFYTHPTSTTNIGDITERARITSGGNFGIGTTSPSRLFVARGAVSLSTTDPTVSATAGAYADLHLRTWSGAVNSPARITVVDNWMDFVSTYTDGFRWSNYSSDGVLAERARITSGGDLLVGKTTDALGTAGTTILSTGRIFVTANGDEALLVNRLANDGDLVRFYQDTNLEGSISVSGNTVSYNAFAGSHWSQLQDGSKPDILRGTVMESINELCVWPDEQNERLPKSKVSDTAGSKKVYGVFMAWDNDWATTNDMYITAVGAFICRVNGSVTVEEGDLLESNGDGTARVQADDIIRSSTIGKVTSTVKTHQYDDGSYCVPTVLYCG